jgi:hypothetical protein
MGSSFLCLFLVANVPEEDAGFWKKIKRCFLNYNIFQSVPPSADKCELRIQRIVTILFVLLLIPLLAIFIIHFLFGSVIKTVIISSPSVATYLDLYSTYSGNLICTCSQPTINHAEFLYGNYTLHQVCDSIFVTDEWISNLAMDSGATFYVNDFRVTGPHAFQGLRMFCDLLDDAISNSLLQFYARQYLSIYVKPSKLLQEQTQSLIRQFQSSTANNFLLSLSMIRSTTHVNALFSGLQTNYRLSVIKDSNDMLLTPNNYGDCRCDLSANCIAPFSIYSYLNSTILFNVPGFYTGCNVIESLLQSTLQCFYNQGCINKLQTSLSPSLMHVSALSSSSSVYFENSTVRDLLDHLMIEKWNWTTLYENYYAACQPTQCTYSTVGMRDDAIYIVIIMVLIVGGPVPVLKFILSLLVKIIACCIRKPPRRVVPEMPIVYT